MTNLAPLTGIASLADVELRGKRVLIREDFNVPLHHGRITNTARIDAALPTIQRCIEAGAAVLLLSHLGRPAAGQRPAALSLAPVAEALSRELGVAVPLIGDWREGVRVAAGEVVLLENVRFEAGEEANDEALAGRLAALCDVFVMDAFGTAHRAHASTCGVVRAAPVACAGPLLEAELEALARVRENPARPMLAIVGGAKVSSKLKLLESLATRVDQLVVGGGIANTFLLASGANIGASLAEPELVEVARRIMARVEVPLPMDVMTAPVLAAQQPARLRPWREVGAKELIVDLGPRTLRHLQPFIQRAGTIIWNGPLGVFEFDQFGEGTRMLAEAVAESAAFSIAGGGDTLAAVDKYGVRDGICYLSTGGGAFLAAMEGKPLPAVVALQERAAR